MIFKFAFAFCILAASGCVSQQDRLQTYQSAQSSGICNVHHIQMYKENVEIAYGLIIFPPGGPSYEVVSTQFPYANHFVLGGCVTGKDSPERKEIYICPLCEKAEKEWTNYSETRRNLQFVPKKA